ncbi:DnaA regulatory inactivator Hda [Thiosulfatimonas sediminis]|uniref:DnaA regulatory inactivator Hda n=1 Tax=Thiosulfatimonas sediminis TaxID=2675054 RepID=A0A6F8PW39_9GAMM|nr:DnaA regulatory inactivator Hda [Thiosulfatimonas sediminis]BBP46218.1 DnaA regulatory inactivator Hda [Thiosulfatimonas sediminis]
MFVQMPLKMGLRDDASFETFVAEQESVAVALNALQTTLSGVRGGAFYLCGEAGVGKTHVLQAACRFVTERNQASVYLPMGDESLPLIPDVLHGLEQTTLVCLDDVDVIIGKKHWEAALANLIVKSNVQGNTLIFAGSTHISHWNIVLPDLAKALVSVLPVELLPLADTGELIVALQRHSRKRGFELPHNVGEYLVKHCSQKLPDLMELLNVLEEATLVEKRRLTLSLVKSVLPHTVD